MNKRKIISILLTGLFFAIPQLGLASENRPDSIDWGLETQGWSIEDHIAAAKIEEQKVQNLQSRVQDMENQLAEMEKKPYFDPKGMQRNALKLLKGKIKGKVEVLNDRIAWHYRQADQAKLVQ